jgi:ribosome-associated protein
MTEKNITTISPKTNLNKVTDAELRQLIIDAIQDKKGRGISVINLSSIESAPAQEFIVCEGRTPQQVAAIADNVRESLLEKVRVKPYNYDGYRNATWIVIDYGTTYVHVFVPDARSLYNLEDLWSDAEITEIPDLD